MLYTLRRDVDILNIYTCKILNDLFFKQDEKGKVEDTVTTDKPSDKTYPWRPTKTDTQVYHTYTHTHTHSITFEYIIYLFNYVYQEPTATVEPKRKESLEQPTVTSVPKRRESTTEVYFKIISVLIKK